MKDHRNLAIALLLGAFSLASMPAGQASGRSGQAGSLKPSRTVNGQVLTSAADPPLSLRVAAGFTYVGGHRFILRDVADAEQHFFADADGKKAVKRLYWIQFEQFLPGRDGKYAYENDAPRTLSGLTVRTNVRRFTEPPAPDSDRRRAYDFLMQAGLTMPGIATRARLVYLPNAAGRQEVMIIYVEPAATGDAVTPAENTAIIQRAIEGISIRR